jgi:hypothetical protein
MNFSVMSSNAPRLFALTLRSPKTVRNACSALVALGISSVGVLTASQAQALTTFSGIFDSTDPGCTTSQTCSGIGTDTFVFGKGSLQTKISFISATSAEFPNGGSLKQPPKPGEEFALGILSITNGTVDDGSYPRIETNPDSVLNTIIANLRLTINTDGSIYTQDNLDIAYAITPNLNPTLRSPANADKVYLPRFPSLGELNILEGSSASSPAFRVIVKAKLGSIDPVKFEYLDGDGSIDPISPGRYTQSGFYVVDLGSLPNPNPNPDPIPTPALLPGLVTMGLLHLRKIRKQLTKLAAETP